MYEPYKGIKNGPATFAVGLAKGSMSVTGHIAAGTFDLVGGLSQGLGNTMAMMVDDDETMLSREQELGNAFGAKGVVQDPHSPLTLSIFPHHFLDACTKLVVW